LKALAYNTPVGQVLAQSFITHTVLHFSNDNLKYRLDNHKNNMKISLSKIISIPKTKRRQN